MWLQTRSTTVAEALLAGMFLLAGCAAGEVAPSNGDGGGGTTPDAAPDVGPNDPDGTTLDTVDGTSEGCQSDGDCDGNAVCVYDADGSPPASCQPPPGDGTVGDSCGSDADCRSGLCRDGSCTAPCSEDADCGDDDSWICSDETVDGNDVSICVPDDSGGKSCFTDDECPAQEKCIAQRQQDGIATQCGPPNQGGGTIGAACEADDECYYNLCVDNRCTTPCDVDDDCPADSDLTCRDTEVQFENGSGTTAVCAPSVTCSSARDCEDEQTCYVQREQTGESGACRIPNPGGGELGDVCSKDSNCAANLCYDGRFRDVCTVPCSDDTDCTKPGFNCETSSIPDGNGGTRDLKFCKPAEASECSSSADCPTDKTCAIVDDSDSGGLTSVCIPDPGGTPTGASCQNDDDCKNLVCQDGFCAAPCQSTNDHCANNQVCREAEVEKAGSTANFRICETLPEYECTTTGECNDDYRVCSRLQTDSNDNVEAYCQFPNEGGQSLGTTCSSHGDCRSGLCLGDPGSSGGETPFADKCSVACTKNEHCASGQTCTTLDPDTGTALCRQTCTINSDCPGGYACTTNVNQLDSPPTLDYVCLRKGDHIPFGEPCGPSASSNDRCKSGVCLTTPGDSCSSDADCPSDFICNTNQGRCERHRCSRLCQDNAQCESPMGVCGEVQVQLSTNTERINACVN